MNDKAKTTSVTGRSSLGNVPNSWTSTGQNQFGGGDNFIAMATQGVDKGGMRGIGLLAVAIAEFALKKKAIDLAEDYYNVNKRDYDFFRANHQGPMQATAQEAFGPNNPTYNYDLYASVPAGIAKAAVIDRQWYEARRRAGKYNMGQMRRLDYDMALAKTHAVMSGWNIATRYEYNWTDERNNRAFDKKITVSNMGIGMGNIIRQGLSSSVSNLTNAYDNVADRLVSIGNGYQMRSGYEAGRANTKERFDFKLPEGMKNG